jgi:parallel beta-helix repeat protein
MMAVSLTVLLTSSILVGFLIQWIIPGGYIDIPDDSSDDVPRIPHGAIWIDGDANFSATALLEGWPGDGSPENPFIIDALEIDLEAEFGNCIMISNTRVSFTISNCNLTRANVTHQGFGMVPSLEGAGIHLLNVSNGELISNICNNNTGRGIFLEDSTYNTLANNTCNKNEVGIYLDSSDANTVVNNTCTSNYGCGISVGHYWDGSDHNTLANNICTSNEIGISIHGSNHTTVVHNTCNSNDDGFFIDFSYYNTLENNTCTNNTCGIKIYDGNYNTVIDNTCTSHVVEEWWEEGTGILVLTDFNTVANNTCYNNDIGITISERYNIVTNNTCNSNEVGIYLETADSNTVENNMCTSNDIGIHVHGSNYNTAENNTCTSNEIGILLESDLYIRSHSDGRLVFYWGESNNNTVTNNICNNNEVGIRLEGSSYNTVESNICNINDIGISLNRKLVFLQKNNSEYCAYSLFNTVTNNTCNYNRVGIYLLDPHSNIVVNNFFLGNTEHDILMDYTAEMFDTEEVQFLHFLGWFGFISIILLVAGWIVGKRVSKGE